MRPNITLRPRELARAIGAVALGGAIGTLLRDLALRIAAPGVSTGTSGRFEQLGWAHFIPWTLLVINAVGVFAATRLLRGRLRGHDPNDVTRLFIITGFFGGFTSYSALFVDFSALWRASVAGCLVVAAGAIASGVAAGFLGLHHRAAR
jgi:fluoride exporter